MAKVLVSFTAQYQGCIELDVPEGDDVEDILYDQTHQALFAACETKIAMDIFNVEEIG